MKIPTGKYLIRKTINSVSRFPLPILASLTATILSVVAVENNFSFDNAPLLYKFLLSSLLAIPLFVALQLMNERLEVTRRMHLLVNAAGFLVLIFYFLSISDVFYTKTIIRFLAYFCMLVLSITFAPYIGLRQNTGFWRFNSILMRRLLITVLYGAILFVGISLAFVAIEQLFDVRLGEDLYFELWVVIVLFFGTWFFLSAMPRYLDKLNQGHEYPPALKIFVQFILIPIVILYSVILYAYFVKVIAMWEWPHGWVASLIVGYSILSIFTFLIIYPIRQSPVNTYVRFFSGFFPYLLWPLIVILFVAIFKRVSDYGFTENRYFVVVLGGWLLFIMTYLLMTRFRDIKTIPVALAITMFLTVTGPWSAFVVSKNSQVNQFEKILNKYNKIENGVYKKNAEVMTYQDYNELLSHSNYVLENYGHKLFADLFPGQLDTVQWDSVFVWEYSSSNPITDLMAIDYIEDTTQIYNDIYLKSTETEDLRATDISGYSYFLPFEINSYYTLDQTRDSAFTLRINDQYRIEIRCDSSVVFYYYSDSLIGRTDIEAMIKRIPEHVVQDSSYAVNPRYLKTDVAIHPAFTVRLSIQHLTGGYHKKELRGINELKGYFLIKTGPAR